MTSYYAFVLGNISCDNCKKVIYINLNDNTKEIIAKINYIINFGNKITKLYKFKGCIGEEFGYEINGEFTDSVELANVLSFFEKLTIFNYEKLLKPNNKTENIFDFEGVLIDNSKVSFVEFDIEYDYDSEPDSTSNATNDDIDWKKILEQIYINNHKMSTDINICNYTFIEPQIVGAKKVISGGGGVFHLW